MRDHDYRKGKTVAYIRPFAGIRYSHKLAEGFSNLIAPPYDVLDESARAVLQRKDPRNIVAIDLPHMPPKTAGPDSVYQAANARLRTWLADGTLARDPRPALYPYTQTYQHGERTFHRRGFIALVQLSPFGAGQVVPHEKTHKGPIEDRLKLMIETGAQLSPIFGLFSDPRNEVNNTLYQNLAKPEYSGTLENVQNDLWHVNDAAIINSVTDLMTSKPVYIADGHHRYTTALQYQQIMTEKNGGPLPADHPANYCMFVLVAMQDPGLLILPTHRLLGGLEAFDAAKLQIALGSNATVERFVDGADPVKLAAAVAHAPAHTFGVYDGKAQRGYLLKLGNANALADLEPGQSQAWRELDVAILQRYLIDDIIRPTFCRGLEPVTGYTADAGTIRSATAGGLPYQLALLLQSTPLHALEQLGKHNEVMPQKSTYFFPKLATGMVMNPLV